jgi:FkbM family methyltransferase
MRLLRQAVRRFGWDVHRFRPSQRPEMVSLVSMLKLHKVDLVFDIGANCGQYAAGLRGHGYQGRIISFEPLIASHSRLVEASKDDPQWIAADLIALGPEHGSATMNIAGNNSESSSFLPMLDVCVQAAPEAAYVGTETVSVLPLDDVSPEYVQPDNHVFLKLDVQGFEASVLDGAPITLARAIGIQIEMTFTRLYDGQPTFIQMFERIASSGFVPWGLLPAFSHPKTGQVLQCDGVFFRDVLTE